MHVKCLLLLINYINDMIHPEGKMGDYRPMIEEGHVVNRANEVIVWCRAHKIPIIHVCTAFHDNYIDLPTHSPLYQKIKEREALKMNTWSTNLYEDIYHEPSDTLLVKHRISAFYGTELKQILQAHTINTLLIGGIATSGTVELTAREAHDRDLYSIVLSDLCADQSNTLHEQSLFKITQFSKVLESKELTNRPS